MSSDPEKLDKLRSRFIKHEDHYDISRWHLLLHPSVAKECARNALPHSIGQFFHPTQAVFTGRDGRRRKWDSRAHRKHLYGRPTIRHLYDVWLGVWNMIRDLEYYNVSWWVALAFTIGSIIWVVNGFAAFLPFCNSHFEKAPDSQGWTAFLGATVFEIGSIFGILEAWNRDDAIYFGSALKHAVRRGSGDTNEPMNTAHEKSQDYPTEPSPESADDAPSDETQCQKRWKWFSTNPDYFREFGFLAAFFQLLGASVFWISGFTAIPPIQTKLQNNQGLNDGIFWTPQVIGGPGFVISGLFMMLEEQDVWWKPKILSLGWNVGFWNCIGGVGFTMSGAFGFGGMTHWTEYQSALSTFWGGWAFLIGSLVQWYECVNRESE